MPIFDLTTSLPPSDPLERHRLRVQGVVQGVGFRPFVYGLAAQLRLVGWVGNDSAGVLIEVEGSPSALATFQEQLTTQPPPLAHIESLTMERIAPLHEAEFVIVHSQAQAADSTLISPDGTVCDDCLRELFEPQDRRYRYPFINCTNCGPRFTIIRDIPYDRPLTTMAAFPMCAACQAEYDDPLNRRFHAQPNACSECGPQLSFRWSESASHALRLLENGQPELPPLELTQQLLALGGVVAVKGLGGFHLACDGTNNQAVRTLRQRKGRVNKPFALMALNVETVRRFAEVSEAEATLLTSRARPIVLLKQKPNSLISKNVAPGNRHIGVMLPYTPLHYLLLDADLNSALTPNFQPLVLVMVMTSGNYVSEPIVKDNQAAFTHLSPLVDGFLLHNREIHARCDDSVMRVYKRVRPPELAEADSASEHGMAALGSADHHDYEMPIRRSRGYAPFPVKLPFAGPSILAVGGELKSTFCLTKNQHAFMSQHIGDMENWETMQAFEQAMTHFQSLFRATPEAIVADKHPGYLSSKWAADHRGDLPLIQVQHHHAHIAAVMAEHGHDGRRPVIGFSFDGTGYGSDGNIWGGELLLTTYTQFERLAHLKYVPLPGGDTAIKRPYRLALAHLWAADLEWADHLPPVVTCRRKERHIIQQQLERGLNAPLTSSMGRLFDAVASLLGLRHTISYEGQAAIELEAIADQAQAGTYRFDLSDRTPIEIDAAPVLQAILTDMASGLPVATISAKFHQAVADVMLELSLRVRAQTGLSDIALSGGVFQNMTLLQRAVKALQANQFTVLTHRLVPPNDGGLALGQAAIGSQMC